MPPQFVLASASPRRRELLASLGIRFSVVKPEIDETQRPGETARDYVRRLSVEKAHAVAKRVDASSLVLAADTVVILAGDGEVDGEILGKPENPHEARVMLQRLRERPHAVCTALTLLQMEAASPARELTRLTETRVVMRDYSDAEIEAYIASGDPFDKAGGYAIQHEGFHPVAHIEGSYTNVVGLPLETLKAMLAEIRFPGFEAGS
ncbi:MAG: Maf family protein [Chloroflexota bacterium]|nr:MAG: septum formation protein Maf [Chloroflexota bacterium]